MQTAVYQLLSTGGGIMPSAWSILLHFINFAILTLVLFRFIYKPVKKSIIKRQEEAQKAIDENAALQLEVEKMKSESAAMGEAAREEALSVHQKVLESASRTSEEIVSKAHAQARQILEEAKKESANIRESVKEDIRSEITQISVSVASNILSREISAKENDAFIEKCIQSWEKND